MSFEVLVNTKIIYSATTRLFSRKKTKRHKLKSA